MLKPVYPTPIAAALLGRSPQTLRAWSCLGGPLEPVRLNGRGGPLGWRRVDLERLLGVELTADDIRAAADEAAASAPQKNDEGGEFEKNI